jgi:hypothetical protein
MLAGGAHAAAVRESFEESDLALDGPAVAATADRHGLEGDEGSFILELPPAVLR